jgi:hypothetical protein
MLLALRENQSSLEVNNEKINFFDNQKTIFAFRLYVLCLI